MTDTVIQSEPAKVQKIIELKLPLTYLITAVVTLLFALGGLYVKFDTLSQTVTRLDTKTDQRDDRIQVLLQTSVEIKSQISAQDQRMIRAESDVKEIRADFNSLRNEVNRLNANQRWMPK